MTRYDAAGNEYSAEDVLDAEELTAYHAHEPSRSYRRTPARIFRALDDDGCDSEGWAHGADYPGRSS